MKYLGRNVLATISAFDPLWNKPSEQVTSQISIKRKHHNI